MACKGVIFDLDGTLIDSLADIAAATNAALAEQGFPTHELPAYRYFVGEGMRALAEKALPVTASPETVDDTTQRIRHYLDQAWHHHTQPYEGIERLLKTLKESLPMAVLSNKPHLLTQAAVDYFFAEIPFEPVLGVSEDTPPKPVLIGANRIVEQWRTNPEEIVYVGDTKTDMVTAKTAGFYAVGVCWGFRPAQELREQGADALLTQPAQLLEIIASFNTRK